ncbi:probable receptor-like protein kinase At1g80640 [Euphorbia lathyris]|uniref:probable receptor-like protein kinase At1g80640 n=1 Tax=Euphorbia lathyris TaxID=212925 RepID=UPI00331448CA
MNLVGLFLPMWPLFSATYLFFSLDARPDSTFSSVKMEAHSPGMSMAPVVTVIHHQDLNKRILIALIVASSVLAGIFFFFSCFCIHRMINSKNSNDKKKQFEVGKEQPLSLVSKKLDSSTTVGKNAPIAAMEYHLLEAATNNFREKNLLGEGGRGRVYTARFNNNLLAAVKKLENGLDVQREFENEKKWLMKIRHQNIISLLGYCIHDEAKFLVYEMMQNGSLDSQLHGPTHGSALTWNLRMKIAVDVARGLEYLHEHSNPPVVHRDLKSSNILLDSNFNAKLSDFGLAVTSRTENKNIKLSGTLGYVAPEYLLEGKLTEKSDVYAFGVVLLELLTGRRPVKKISQDNSESIVTWALPQLTDRAKLPNIVDPVINNSMDLKHLYQVAAVAVLCIQQEPSYRPLITDVLHSLIPLLPLELGGSLRITEPAGAATQPAHQ